MTLISNDSVFQWLRKTFKPPAYIVLGEVRNTTGYARRVRIADALVLSTWPSRGLYIHGFEIKSSRNDWLREFGAPEKAEEIFQFCP